MVAASFSLLVDKSERVNRLTNELAQVKVGILSNIMKLAVLPV